MKKEHVREFFERLRQQNPEPKGELHYVNPYTLLVAVVLSAQATDKGVNKATEPLFKKVKTPEQMVKLGEAGVRDVYPDATIVRPSVVFGPEDEFFNRFGAMAQLFPALPLRHLNKIYSYTHTHTHSDGHAHIFTHTQTNILIHPATLGF